MGKEIKNLLLVFFCTFLLVPSVFASSGSGGNYNSQTRFSFVGYNATSVGSGYQSRGSDQITGSFSIGTTYTGRLGILKYCGNSIIDSGETCDSTNLNSQTCSTRGYSSGTLACNSDCSGFDTSGCTTTTTVTTPSPTGGGSYSGTPPSPTAFSSTTSVDVSTGDFVALSVAQGASFIVKNVEHFVDVKEIGEDFARLWIYSEPVEVLLKVGKRASVDVDNDTLTDVSVELRGISNGYALLYFKELKGTQEVKLPEGQKVLVEEPGQKPLELPKLELLPKIGAKTFLMIVIENFESWIKNMVQKITNNKYWLTLSLLLIVLLFVGSFKHYLRKPSIKNEDLPVKKRKIRPYLLALIILILIMTYLIFRIKGYDMIIFEKLNALKDFN